MQRALTINEKSYGPEHPTVARDLNNLALLLQATNRRDDAERLMRRALAIDEKRLGPEHPEVATALGNLAEMLRATNRLDEAERLMRRTLVIFLEFGRHTGQMNPHLQAAIVSYAGLLKEMGKSNAEIEATLKELILPPK